MTTTKERPVSFNAEMIRAILAGQKTQTRRIIKPQPVVWNGNVTGPEKWLPQGVYLYSIAQWRKVAARRHCPYGWIGDRLWVRETLTIEPDTMAMVYRADGSRMFRDGEPMYYPQNWPWQRSVLPSIFMPRWACRILLEVTGVRVERVQDISEGDAVAEGEEPKEPNHVVSARYRFGQLWNSLNAKRGFGWETNPWVWVVEFAIHDGERPRYD